MDTFTPQLRLLMAKLVQQTKTGALGEPGAIGDYCLPLAAFDPNDVFVSRDCELEVLCAAREIAMAAVTAYFDEQISCIAPRRNQCAPIYRLPNELFIEIFEHARAAEREEEPRTEMPVGRALSQVSRLWRELAIRMPTLWTVLDTPNFILVHEFASRSKGMLLDVDFQHRGAGAAGIFGSLWIAYEENVRECLALLARDADRLQSITLKDIRRDTIRALFTYALPQLIKLDLSIEATCVNDALPPLFHLQKPPRLRHLRLQRFHIDLSSSLYSGLTVLQLHDTVFPLDSILQLVYALKESPLLEFLHLDMVAFSNAALVIPQVVTLPHLTDIMIRGLTSQQWITFLSSISPSPSLKLTGHHRMDARDVLSHFLPDPAMIALNIPSILRTISLDFTFPSQEEDSFSLFGHGESILDCCIDLTFQSANYHPIGAYSNSSARSLAKGVFADLGQALPLPNLRRLYLANLEDEIMSTVVFVSVLERFSGLEELGLDACDSMFMRTLGSTVSFPNLVRLSLSFVTLEEYTSREFGDMLDYFPNLLRIDFDSCSPEFIQVLAATPGERALCPELETLSIARCSITGDDLLDLVESRRMSKHVLNLAIIEMTDCDGVDDEALEELDTLLAP